jgi:hypothetical protein
MRRRSFIATLPLAAATPSMAADQGPSVVAADGTDGWTDLDAAETTFLASVRSRNIRVRGGPRISAFGPAPGGLTKVLRFEDELVLAHTPGRLETSNSGQDLLISPGDVVTTISLGGDAWVVAAYQPASVFAKIDRRRSKGGGPFKLAIGADARTGFPDFAVDGAFGRTKTVSKSLILGDPGDTTEVGAIAASGTAAAPTARVGYAPHHINYSFAPHVPLDLKGAPGTATYNGRFAQEYFFQLETPGPQARGGGIAWGVTQPGHLIPFDRMWLRNFGLVLPGRAVFEDSGFEFGYIYGKAKGGAPANYHHIFAPGPVNWGDVAGWGNLSLIAADETTGCAVLAIRRTGDLGRGHDLMYSLSADELRLHTVSGDVRTARWGVPVDSGHLLPATPRQVDLGSAARPVRAVHADHLEVSRASRGPAAFLESGRPDQPGDLLTLSAARTPGGGFNFLRAVSVAGEAEEQAALIDGSGHAAIAGPLLGEGSSTGAFMEWADGNPVGEDRIGWSVVLEGRKIRRAKPHDAPHKVVGVVTARAHVAADAAWRHWAGRYLTDELGRPLTRPVEHLRWSESVFETQLVERQRAVTETVRRPRLETFDIVEHRPTLVEADGRWEERLIETRRTMEQPATLNVVIHGEDGLPLLDELGVRRTADVPVHEEVEVERTETWVEPLRVEVGRIEHCYPAHAIPADVVVPADAERFAVLEKQPNPAFDPSLAYEPRSRRAEWDVVAFCGPELLRKGEVVGDRWILMRTVSATVEEWLVR